MSGDIREGELASLSIISAFLSSGDVGGVSDLAQISIKKCTRMPSDSALESSLAAKLGTMQLCVCSIVIKAFPKEEGNVTTEKYHGGQFR